MVVTFLLATLEMGATQERTAFPSMWTVQAPQSGHAASELGAGESQLVTKNPEQWHVSGDVERVRPSVYGKR